MTSDRCEASWELLFLLKEAVTKENKRVSDRFTCSGSRR